MDGHPCSGDEAIPEGSKWAEIPPHERDEKNHVGEKTALWVHWSSGRLVESRFGFSFFSHEQFLVLAVLSENGPPSVHTHRLGMYIRLPI